MSAPSWLFSNNFLSTTNPAFTPSAPSSSSTTMAKGDKKSASKATGKDKKARKAPKTTVPPVQLMDLVENFLSENDFSDAHKAFKKQRAQKGLPKSAGGEKAHTSLVSVFQDWETSLSKNGSAEKKVEVDKVTSVSSSDSDDVDMKDAARVDEDSSSSDSDSSSESSSSSDSDSESDSDDEQETRLDSAKAQIAKATAQVARVAKSTTQKRKAESDSESSSSSSSSSDSSDSRSDSSSEDEKPQAKKQKVVQAESSSESSSEESSSEESSSEESSSEEEFSEEESSSESDSDSSSESDAESEIAKAVAKPLPESDSDSDSDSSSSESESEDSDAAKQVKQEAKEAVVKQESGSDSSATLGNDSPQVFPVSTFAPLPPDPTIKANNRGKKNGNERRDPPKPFSRIKDDVVVDPRLASNAFAGHEWGQKAHEDLIVTRGKGFTKEKNKKKKGSYHGGRIDTFARGGIKFDD